MSTKFAAKKAQSVWIDWAESVAFDVAVVARRHTQTSLQATPMTVEYAEIPQEPFHVLDPGAGVGTLSAAVCQRVLQQKNRRHLVFE